MTTPMRDAARDSLVLLDHIGGGKCECDPETGAECEACMAKRLARRFRADLDADDGEYERVAKIREYATESAAVCRKAEEARRSDLSKRENGTIADMLREQTFAWGEKAKSYDALVEFIDSLSRPTPKPVAPKPATKDPDEVRVHALLDREYKRAQEDFRRRMADIASDPLPRDLILKMPIHGRRPSPKPASERCPTCRNASGLRGLIPSTSSGHTTFSYCRDEWHDAKPRDGEE